MLFFFIIICYYDFIKIKTSDVLGFAWRDPATLRSTTTIVCSGFVFTFGPPHDGRQYLVIRHCIGEDKKKKSKCTYTYIENNILLDTCKVLLSTVVKSNISYNILMYYIVGSRDCQHAIYFFLYTYIHNSKRNYIGIRF